MLPQIRQTGSKKETNKLMQDIRTYHRSQKEECREKERRAEQRIKQD